MSHIQVGEQGMRRTLRLWLPIVQVLLAVTLTGSNFIRQHSTQTASWRDPDRQFCDALNAPAALVRFFLLKGVDYWLPNHSWIDFSIETIVYFGLVGLLWYSVGIELGGSEGRKPSALVSRIRLGGLADAVLVCFGLCIALTSLLVLRQFGAVTSYPIILSIPYFVWGAALVLFYARDLKKRLTGATEKTVINQQ